MGKISQFNSFTKENITSDELLQNILAHKE